MTRCRSAPSRPPPACRQLGGPWRYRVRRMTDQRGLEPDPIPDDRGSRELVVTDTMPPIDPDDEFGRNEFADADPGADLDAEVDEGTPATAGDQPRRR